MDEITIPQLVELPPTSNMNDVLAQRVAKDPAATIIERTDGAGGWTPLTGAAFDAEVVAVAKGLVAKGVEPGDAVGIMSKTRYEWTLLDFAAWAAGAVPVPIYETSSAEQVQWILTDADVRLLVVETPDHAATVAEVSDDAPALREVLTIDQGGIDALVAAGADVPDDEIARRRALANLDDLATIIYTSGTTGRPKGAELTHGNFASLAVNAVEAVPTVFTEGGRTLLFLPLAHVFARFVEVLAIAAGTVLGHWGDLKTVTAGLESFRPTYILAVPRVFEKVYNSAEQKAAAGGKLKIFHWAAATAIEWSRALDTPKGPSLWLNVQHKVADKLVYSKLRAVLGGQARHAVSGGGPLGERLGHFFRGLGLTVLEGYGLTESTAPTSVNRPDATKIGTVGTQLPGCGVKLAPDGEILLRGIHIFRGYHNNPEATAEAFDGEWFRTGDLGTLDDDGFLTITGRKKEIIVTAAGKNVAPAVLEDRIRAHALVSQCVVVGDNRPFIGALVTLDAEGLPGWLKMHGKPEMTPAQAKDDPDVLAALDAAVARANKAVSKAESIRKFAVLDGDLTIENGYLTPKQSVRRHVFVKDFAAEIDKLYEDTRETSAR
ncbi:long-chain fatty acid--CoA ligase [Isoptericola variabilis]|uniref:Acyl-CoA synthetase n=1 Tax=Isoptericola variabilis (strain 225) TaxID=743718 RepID=F6FWJ0_ISOV2|nr:AMP-dependent synthetase/ligase [Isoptericola variabilis]AEG44564.1 Long-chain-fatty-acid--CoA ligase [Isoptericola variabilis 225]TWH28921.1 long-chain acyl-CoA synthetase [Isoptericola variabilis J7]